MKATDLADLYAACGRGETTADGIALAVSGLSACSRAELVALAAVVDVYAVRGLSRGQLIARIGQVCRDRLGAKLRVEV